MRTTLYLPVEREGLGAANPEGGTKEISDEICKYANKYISLLLNL